MYSWQYNGVAPMSEIIQWCHKHLDTNDINDYWKYDEFATIYFLTSETYTWFLLRWS